MRSGVLEGRHWGSVLATTLADETRMDHTTLWSINTSMRNAWFCSALSGCIQQHSSASVPTLSCMPHGGMSSPSQPDRVPEINF